MEFSQIALNNGLTFLCWATGIIVIVVGIFLVKLILDLSVLSKNLNETSQILNAELKPTLSNLSQTLQTINDLVKTTDKGMVSFKDAVEKLFTKTKSVSGLFLGGLFKGLATVINMFIKK